MKTFGMKAAAAAVIAASLSGCIGSNAVTGYVMKFNLEVVDNRYARGGVNILLAPVYGLAIAADYIVFNSLEFWTGKNPLNGKPHIFDSKLDTKFKINDDLDPSLQDAPVAPISNLRSIETGTMQQIDADTIQMDIVYNNGEKAVLTGVREGKSVSYYIDGQLITTTTITQLEELVATKA